MIIYCKSSPIIKEEFTMVEKVFKLAKGDESVVEKQSSPY